MRKIHKSRKRGKYFFFLFIIILLIIVALIKVYPSFNKAKPKNHSNNNLIEKEREPDKLSLVMVGDNLIHDKIYQYAKTETGYEVKPILTKIKPIIQQYDIAYYNQETILGGSELGLSSYPAFNSPFEVGDAMVDAGFNLVSLATNHTMDRGKQAVLNSRTYWDNQKNVLAVGSYSSQEDKNKLRIITKNNISYTMLNYTYGINGINLKEAEKYLVNIWPVNGQNPSTDNKYQQYKEQIKKDIEAVRDKVDVLLVAMHWGIEYQTLPNEYQKDMASYLASLGADIIIGTHPHVIEPVTWINNTLVIYSLGNFLSAHEVVNLANRVGLMSMVDIYKENDKIILKNLENELLYTYYTSDYQDFLIVPFSSMEEKYLSNYQEVYNQYKTVVQTLDKSIKVN